MWAGWGGERRSLGSARPLPPLFCPADEKAINGNCEQGCEGKSSSEEVKYKWLKRVPLHKYARVHNNFKS